MFACEVDPNEPLTSTEKALGGCGILSFLVGLFLIGLFVGGCTSPDCGSKTIVGNHYALPKISHESSNTDIEIYESTEGAMVYTRRDSKVEIDYNNSYTNRICGIWNKVGVMNLRVVIEPLDCSGESEPEPEPEKKPDDPENDPQEGK